MNHAHKLFHVTGVGERNITWPDGRVGPDGFCISMQLCRECSYRKSNVTGREWYDDPKDCNENSRGE